MNQIYQEVLHAAMALPPEQRNQYPVSLRREIRRIAGFYTILPTNMCVSVAYSLQPPA